MSSSPLPLHHSAFPTVSLTYANPISNDRHEMVPDLFPVGRCNSAQHVPHICKLVSKFSIQLYATFSHPIFHP